MTETAIVRRATVSDIPAIVAMLADDALGSTRENPDDQDAYDVAFACIDADPNQFLAVMECDGMVVGTLQLTFIPGLSFQGMTRAQIEAVRIASSERGKGLGHQLFTWAIDEAKRRGVGMVQLTANASRTEAHRFYQSLGFEPTHVGFKLAIATTPTDEAHPAPVPAADLAVDPWCDPETGICAVDLPFANPMAAPDLAALGKLGGLSLGAAKSGDGTNEPGR